MICIKRIFLLFLCFNLGIYIYSKDLFEEYFSSGAMRIDFVLTGDAESTNIFLQRIIREPFWGGRKTNLNDTLNYGNYFFSVTDIEDDNLIFSGSFSTLFCEWQTTAEAQTVQKTFSNSIRIPYPLRPVNIDIFIRKKDQSLAMIKNIKVDPADSMIKKISLPAYKIQHLGSGGLPENSVDIAILAEGYTKKEKRKFINDAKRLTEYMFSIAPFSNFRNVFNLNLVFSVSSESGTDIPSEGIWRNTVFNSNFCTFDIERYLTVFDYWKICDIASCVPYDQIIILVNSDRYGGGGIYNFYSICTSNHKASFDVFVHEFGHAFAGLGDEYYTSDVTYENFYDTEHEPWEPNLTTMKNFERKWKDMVQKGIPVPTPNDEKYSEIVGAFEGGGYVPKGIYRPQLNCRMKDNSANDFCKVCQRAIERMISLQTE